MSDIITLLDWHPTKANVNKPARFAHLKFPVVAFIVVDKWTFKVGIIKRRINSIVQISGDICGSGWFLTDNDEETQWNESIIDYRQSAQN